MEILGVNFIHLLHLARSSCEKCNYKPSGRNRPCDSGAAELNSIVFVLIAFIVYVYHRQPVYIYTVYILYMYILLYK